MTRALNTYTYTSRKICRLLTSLVLCLVILFPSTLHAQKRKQVHEEPDTIPFFKGFAVSVNISGPIVRSLSDYGEYEAALRINLHDQYFPIFELGYGDCDHYEEVTEVNYSTSAPYFRIGCDFNLLKNKHADNRLYGGFRYGFTSYNVDIARYDQTDPVWETSSDFIVDGESCSYHWIEGIIGVDAKIFGPIHLGWNVRYRRRITGSKTSVGKTWYVPGYGKWGGSRLGADFCLIIDI